MKRGRPAKAKPEHEDKKEDAPAAQEPKQEYQKGYTVDDVDGKKIVRLEGNVIYVATSQDEADYYIRNMTGG